jgi:hypothetical protein
MIMLIRRFALTLSLFSLLIGCCQLQAQDSLMAKQELYNGRIWINRFLMVKGDQFLFSRSFIPGRVTIKGSTFDVNLRYDINEDEIHIIAGHFGVLQVNKELVDSFTIAFNNRDYHFITVRNDTLPEPAYLNLLYKGAISLYARYQKKIDKISGGEGSRFYQVNRIYLSRDGINHTVAGKAGLLSLSGDRSESIKTWMKKNHVRVTARDPQSFVPVIVYYNSLISRH